MCDNSTLKRPPRFIIESVVFESLRYFYCLSLETTSYFPERFIAIPTASYVSPGL